MTRKDYELIAASLRHTRETARDDLHPQAEAMHARACNDLANALEDRNPNFDAARFLAACGVQS